MMVTNLPAEAKAKWAEVVACRSTPQKIKLMREFISLVPKHKGTSKLLANVRRRIASLERELEKAKARKKGGRGRSFSVPKEGAGQIIILGPTNVGRSSLLASVTNAKAEVTPVYYATRKPVVGMLPYHDVQFQLVEAPALVEGAADGRMEGPRILGLARNSDGLVLMVDLAGDLVKQFRMMHSELEQAGIMVEKSEGEVEITRRILGAGVQVIGGGILVDGTLEDLRRLLNSYRINSALVRIRGKVTLDNIEDSLFSSNIYKPALVVANKMDASGAEEKLLYLREALKEVKVPLLAISCKNKQGLEELGNLIFQMLRIIRVYTKEPSKKEPSKKPVVVEEGTTVIDIAKKLHSKLYKRFRYARIWGPSAKYPGQKVGSSHLMKDGDIIEIH
jgi:ribosome-interacting GTPase 1